LVEEALELEEEWAADHDMTLDEVCYID